VAKADGTYPVAPFRQIANAYEVGKGPYSLVAGDFNGDGKLDLAVANHESVTILFGNGDGSFASSPKVSLPETGDDS